MKGLAEAGVLGDRAIWVLELADATADTAKRRALLHFVVVGGNLTGVEVAGEFDVFLRHGSRRYLHVNETDVTITLIELGDRILTALDPDLSQYAAAHLRNRGVNLLLNNTVTAIERDRVSLSTGDALSARTVIWCAGIEQNPIVRGWSLPVDERGYILCEHNLRVKGFDNVWAVGDCAVNPDPDGYAYPATAQHAVRQGAHLARNLGAVLKGAQPRPCHIKTRGALAALGAVDPRVVALDADVKNSTFSEKFEQQHPDRFYQMFIAEQVMVGAALGLCGPALFLVQVGAIGIDHRRAPRADGVAVQITIPQLRVAQIQLAALGLVWEAAHSSLLASIV